MLVYFIVYLLTILLCYVVSANDRKKYLLKLIIVFIPLFLFGALREQFNDQLAYENGFYEIHELPSFVYDQEAHYEMGFQWLCYVSPDFRTLLVITSILMCISFIVFFYNNVPQQSLYIAISLLFLSGHFSIYFILASIRNGIAMSFLMLGFVFCQKRQIISFAIVTFLASLVHTSALFAFPLAYLVGRNSKFTVVEICVWFGVMLFFIISTNLSLINIIAPYINSYFHRYDSVIEAEIEIGNTFHPLAIIGTISIFSFLSYFALRRSYISQSEMSIFRVAMLFSLAAIMSAMNARMSQYYSPFIVAATSIIYTRFPKSDIKLVFILLVFAYLGYSFFLWTHSVWFNYSTYHSVLGSF